MHNSIPIGKKSKSLVAPLFSCPTDCAAAVGPADAPDRRLILGPVVGTDCWVGRSPATISHRYSAGFTITELVIALAILLILMIGIMTTYVFSLTGFTAITNYVQLHVNGRQAVNQFLKDVHSAADVVSLSSNASTTTFVVSIATNFVKNSSGVPTPQLLTNNVTYTFNNGDHTFKRTDNLGTLLMATNVDLVQFTMFDCTGTNRTVNVNTAKSIQLDLTLSNRVVSVRQTEDYLSARTVMRNIPCNDN